MASSYCGNYNGLSVGNYVGVPAAWNLTEIGAGLTQAEHNILVGMFALATRLGADLVAELLLNGQTTNTRLTALRAAALDRVPASPAAVGSAMTLAAASIKAATFDSDVSLLAPADVADAVDASTCATNASTAATQATAAAGSAASADSKGTTMLNRLGAWTGTGVNTILGAFKALLSKIASAPSDIGGTFAPTTDSVEALGEKTAAYPINVNPNVVFMSGTNQQDVAVQCFKNGTAPMMARVYNHAAALLTQANVTSIAYSIYLLDDKDADSRTVVTGHSAVALNDTDVIFDTLQTDDLWTADTTGYNFKHVPPIATNQAFTKAGRKYLVEYTITPSSGQKVIVRFRVSVI